jgi:hypothetical protein
MDGNLRAEFVNGDSADPALWSTPTRRRSPRVSEMLLADDAQGPAGNADYLTDLLNRPRHERMPIQDLAEAADDEAMMLYGRGV